MWKRTMKFHPEQTPEQRAFQEKWTRRDDARRVAICNGFEFWRACRRRECKRRHACSGDPHACFTQKWAQVPEDVKAMFRAVAQARKDGLSMEQAVERAAAELAREAEIVAKFEAARAPAEAPRFTPPTPRVRGL